MNKKFFVATFLAATVCLVLTAIVSHHKKVGKYRSELEQASSKDNKTDRTYSAISIFSSTNN